MSFSPGFEAVVSINNTDISAYTEKVAVSSKRTAMKLPRLGGNQVARLVGPTETELKLEGWIDPTVTNVFFPLITDGSPATVPIEYKPEGAGGTDTRTGTGYILDYDEDTDAKNPAMWKATVVVNGDWA